MVISARARACAAFAATLIAFLLLQGLSADYGTLINDTPYALESQVASDVARGSGLDRSIVIAPAATNREGPDLWAFRFKLYPVEADDIVSITALARIRPTAGQYDPGFYQYGGAYLYPLGLWFYGLNRLGVLKIGTIDDLLADPARMDAVWTWGRLFVILAVAAAAAILFVTLVRLTDPRAAWLLSALFLACPGALLFSMVLKPHWYALLWVNAVLYFLVDAADRRRLRLSGELAVGACVGLAVGSATTFALFAVFVWCAVTALAWRRMASIWTLVRIPVVAAAFFAATNPFYFLNWRGYLAERTLDAGWFHPSLDLAALAGFAWNSLIPGLGLAMAAGITVLFALRVVRPGDQIQRPLAAAIVLAFVAAATVTATMADWHVNVRYASYALPLALIFLAIADWPWRHATLALMLAATAAQAVPLKLAYFDENDPLHSTRLRAAAWVDENIPAGDAVCLNTQTPTPYDVPPFHLDRYRINESGCDWLIVVERETDSLPGRPGFDLTVRFRPRLSPERFPLVVGHINPQISVYRR